MSNFGVYAGFISPIVAGVSAAMVMFIDTPTTYGLTRQEVAKIAQEITVLIAEEGQPDNQSIIHGSGILLERKDDTYYILTAYHVVEGAGDYELQTPDGKTHKLLRSSVQKLKGLDLAIAQFSSSHTYQTAKLETEELEVGEPVFVAGYPIPEGNNTLSSFTFTGGQISQIRQGNITPSNSGYVLAYDIVTQRGMSGGPVLNEAGRLVAIHGLAEERAVVSDGTLKFGIPVAFFQERRLQDMFETTPTAQATEPPLALPVSPSAPRSTLRDLTNSELVELVQGITVFITPTDDNQGGGSGVLLSREGGTYHILTTYHILQAATDYEVVTADGRAHKLSRSLVRKLPGLDVAVAQFFSDHAYRTVSLAEGRVSLGSLIIIGGYPISNNLLSERDFMSTTGRVVTHGTAANRRNQGYILGYDIPSKISMSGGPILNQQGQLVAIHGRAERELEGDRRSIRYGIPVIVFRLHLFSLLEHVIN